MPSNAVYIIDATALIYMKQIAAVGNDVRFLDALIAPGQMIITSTVRGEAAGNISYRGDALVDQWLTRQEQLGRLTEIQTPEYIAGSYTNVGDDSIRAIVPRYHNSEVYVISDDGGLIRDNAGANQTISTNRYLTENYINGSITTTEYSQAVAGRISQHSADGLYLPGIEYTGSNGVTIKYGPYGAEVTDRAGIKHIYGLGQLFQINDTDGTVSISSNPARCFLAGTLISVDKFFKKKIEEISLRDSVLAFNPEGRPEDRFLTQKPVVNIFRNLTKQVVDLRGLMCTPGHVFLSGDDKSEVGIKFYSIVRILRADKCLFTETNVPIRARTGACIGSPEDKIVRVVSYIDKNQNISRQKSQILVRAGIPMDINAIKDARTSIISRTLCHYLAGGEIDIIDDGKLRDSGGTCYDASNWPEGSTPFDTPEMQNWIVEVDGKPYTPPWILALTDTDDTEGLQIVGQDRTLAAVSGAMQQHAS